MDYTSCMGKRILITMVAVLLLCWQLAEPGVVHAGDEDKRVSLGYGSLTPLRADPKSQQFGALTARYRLGSTGNLRPYLGTGLAYSYQPAPDPASPAKIKAGVAGQAGFSYLLGEKASLDFDYKLLEMAPDSTRSSGSKSPQSFGVGVKVQF